MYRLIFNTTVNDSISVIFVVDIIVSISILSNQTKRTSCHPHFLFATSRVDLHTIFKSAVEHAVHVRHSCGLQCFIKSYHPAVWEPFKVHLLKGFI